METHRPGYFWGGLRGFAHLLHWFLLLSASKPGNAIIFSSELFLGTLFTHRAQWENPSKSDPFLIWDIFQHLLIKNVKYTNVDLKFHFFINILTFSLTK
jgi:hypothetical protein